MCWCMFQAEKGESNKVGKLLDLLCQGDDNAMDKFIESLKAAAQSHVAEAYLRIPHPGEYIHS